MVHPSTVLNVNALSRITIFVALILGSNYLLAPAANIKLEDTLVFLSAYLYGFAVGSSVAVISEFLWSSINPYGFAGPIMPFLVVGELIYALAGFLSSKVWNEGSMISPRNIIFGSLMAICAFIWDVETNAATALVVWGSGITLAKVLSTELLGVYFMIAHELSDFAFGAFLIPVVIHYVVKSRVDSPLPVEPVGVT
jgi:uncharacterized membrane protein